jgi:hypothetical protein
VQAAIVAAAAFQAQGAKVTALEMMPCWTSPEIANNDEAEAGIAIFKSYLIGAASGDQSK